MVDASLAAVDFRYILLENYKKMGMSEEELAVLLMVDHLTRQGNDLVTADMLSLKMNYPSKQCDSDLAKLLKEGYLSYETVEGKLRTSLEPLKKKLYAQFQADLARSRADLASAERSAELSRIYGYYEKRLERTLSPLENDLINTWLDDAFSEQEIEDALENALAANKRSLKAVDKELRIRRKSDDIAKEGYTGVSDSWSKDIEKTIELAKKKWNEDADK